MYLQILSHTNKVNSQPSSAQAANNVVTPLDLQSNELQFQLSFKTKAWDRILGNNGSLWLGYTQTSRWQVYNASNSRPFRESNYEPEAMFVLKTPGNIAGWQSRMSSVSLTHQSNGQSSPLSRSWNRVIGQWGLEKDNTTLLIRPWWRIPEKAARDDNPGIENFVGRGELVLAHRMGEHVVSFQGRHALRTGENARGSAKIDWAIPMAGYLKAHLSLFSGYGESLVDYNHRQTRIGLGVSLVEWR
jgi:phospholipase A1